MNNTINWDEKTTLPCARCSEPTEAFAAAVNHFKSTPCCDKCCEAYRCIEVEREALKLVDMQRELQMLPNNEKKIERIETRKQSLWDKLNKVMFPAFLKKYGIYAKSHYQNVVSMGSFAPQPEVEIKTPETAVATEPSF